VTEIEEQRPFNTGSTEARQIRDRSHPLCTIEIAVTSLSGLPATFTSRIEALGTEFEIEYVVLGAVDDGVHDIEAIRERVYSRVQTLSDAAVAPVERAVDRLVEKQVLTRDGQTVRVL